MTGGFRRAFRPARVAGGPCSGFFALGSDTTRYPRARVACGYSASSRLRAGSRARHVSVRRGLRSSRAIGAFGRRPLGEHDAMQGAGGADPAQARRPIDPTSPGPRRRGSAGLRIAGRGSAAIFSRGGEPAGVRGGGIACPARLGATPNNRAAGTEAAQRAPISSRFRRPHCMAADRLRERAD